MKRNISLRSVIIGASIFATLGAIALVWAFSQLTYDRPTSLFSVEEEGALADVVTLNAATGSADPGWVSCGATGLAPGQVVWCAVKITNTKTSGPIRYSLHLNPSSINALSDVLDVSVYGVANATSCNAAGATDRHAGPAALSTAPGFNTDPGGPNDHLLAVGATNYMCVKVTYSPGATTPFGQSVSGTLRVVTDDDGL